MVGEAGGVQAPALLAIEAQSNAPAFFDKLNGPKETCLEDAPARRKRGRRNAGETQKVPAGDGRRALGLGELGNACGWMRDCPEVWLSNGGQIQ